MKVSLRLLKYVRNDGNKVFVDVFTSDIKRVYNLGDTYKILYRDRETELFPVCENNINEIDGAFK